MQRENLWKKSFFGYIEGITRLALLLMGDYPDHRKRRQGRKSADYYQLKYHRSQVWLQNADQRLKTLIAAWQTEILVFDADFHRIAPDCTTVTLVNSNDKNHFTSSPKISIL